ncbi:MAG: putative tricarboxylic transport rane protein, partial [Hyphomicrobiales bacterium]
MRQLMAAAGFLAALALPAPAEAQEWPTKQVTLIVPFSAGGTTDLFARLLSQHLQQKTGQPFIVENRAGAGGNLGAQLVARAAPDGTTFLVGTVSTHAINPFIYTKLPYDTVKDFQPVSLIARLPNILVVHPDMPVKTVPELIAYLKANPDKMSYGSSGTGTSIHLAAELFKIKTGTTMTHVPFRSSGDIMNNLTGGHINLAFDNITLAWTQVKAGRLRALAVTSIERSAIAPDVPVMADTIPGFEATSWHGVFAPAGTPKTIVDAMAAEMKRILELPDVKEKLAEIGAIAAPMTPEEFVKFIDGER